MQVNGDCYSRKPLLPKTQEWRARAIAPRAIEITSFSKNLFPIALSRNGRLGTEKWERLHLADDHDREPGSAA
jgi:hypothetical protein